MSVPQHAAAGGPSHAGRARWGRRLLLALVVIASLVLLYTLVGFFVVPRYAREKIEDYVHNTLHRRVELGELRFNPFAFDTSIAGLKLTESDGAPLASFRHLYADAELGSSLRERALVLSEIELTGPDIQLIIAHDGSMNLARLVPRRAQPPGAEKPALPRVLIDQLAITQGRIGFEDHTRPQPFSDAISSITFTARQFATDTGHRTPYQFTGSTPSNEQFDASGDLTVQPLGSTGQFRLQGLKLATVDAYLGESLSYRLASGKGSTGGRYVFRVEPFTLDVVMPATRVSDMTLTERRLGAPTPVKLPQIDVQNLEVSLGKRAIGVGRAELRDAHVDVAREKDGSISLQRLVPSQAQEQAAAPPAEQPGHSDTATAPSPGQAPARKTDWNVHADTIHVDNATINAEDHSVDPTIRFEIAPAAVTVTGWRNDPSARMQVDADVTLNKETRLVGRGAVQLEPLSSSLDFELTNLDLPMLQPYVKGTTAVTLHTGKLSGKGTLSYAGARGAAPSLELTADAQVDDLRTTDQFANADLLNWRNLTASGIQLGLNPDGLVIDRIVARDPYASVVISEDRTLNVVRALSSAGPGKSAPRKNADDRGEPPSDPPGPQQTNDGPAANKDEQGQKKALAGSARTFPVQIRTVAFVNGTMDFADHSIQPSFAAVIVDLHGQITGLSSKQDSRADVVLGGKVDKYAPVDILGEVNLFAATKYTNVAMNFRNMDLTIFNPYSGKFTGYNIERGKLNTRLKYQIVDRKLQAQHHIVLDNLQFGEKTESKTAAPIPIKLAVALLKDRNGVISLDVPVSGSLDDPDFRLAPIIWKAILNVLTKVVTAPFAAIGRLFGGGEELQWVDFPAGSAALERGETEKLEKLARAMAERPALRLVVPLTLTADQDSKALAHAALAAKLPQDTPPPDSERNKRRRLDALEDAYQKLTNSAPQYPPETFDGKKPNLDKQLAWLEQTLMDRLEPDKAALDTLGQQRGHAVEDTLLTNPSLDPERVFLSTEHVEAKTADDKVRMQLQLE
jgi:Domain of Unknown Function (DUF748)